LRDLISAARSLGKNPIGVVALFLVLIYAIAAIGATGDAFTTDQRWPFVWFLVCFPVLVFGVFVFLVVFHHEKLYAPYEYRDERHFFRKLSPEDQKARLDEEVSVHATERSDGLRPLTPDEVRLNVTLAEDLAMRALEQELGCSISREVAVPAGDGWINLDGAVARGDELVAIEVKHYRGGRFALFQIEHLLKLLTELPLKHFRRASLVLAVVSEATEDADRELEGRLVALSSRYRVPVSVRLFRFSKLKNRFGVP